MKKTSYSRIVHSATAKLSQTTLCALILISLLALSGCGDFFSEKATQIESQNIIRDISKLDYSRGSAIDVPDTYKLPPRIIENKIGDKKLAKLFYFTQYHSPTDLAKLIKEQFISGPVQLQIVPTTTPVKIVPQLMNYVVSINEGANQLVVSCPSVKDAEQVLAFLEQVDVPPIQVKIDCIISEVYADHTMDWETTIDVQQLMGSDINLSGKNVEGTVLPAFPGAALRDVARSTFGLKAGFVHGEGDNKVSALIDLLVSRGYLKILMNPTLEVVNGRTATINTEEQIPMDQIANVHPVSGAITYSTRYEPVIDSLEITPTVYGDGYIGIKTIAVIGSKSTPEGVKQVPIVTKREIKVEENRIRAGESLVIGGITKTEKRSVVRGVPFLKDIPVIGVLFSSKDFEERGKEVLFILTPSISTGGIPNKEIVDEIRHKHEMLELDNNILKTFTDPLGHNIYTEMIEKEATDAETKRIRAEIEKDHAVRKAKMLQMELDLARQGKTITSPSQKAKEVVDYQQKHRKKSPHELTIEQWMKKHADKNAKSDL